ncbi:unnamed protein product [Sphagnum jensenii]|uniref:Uncharacterized protein n=1 Tax=Sphagnum jensenii TaxID=128206 RepID=A0ABP0VUP8_9BRYO
MIPLRTKCSATRPRPTPRATSIELHESATDPAEVAAMRRNIPAGCPVSTRDPLPRLSTDIPIIVLSSSDDEEGKNKMYKNARVAAHDLLLVTIHIIYMRMEIADELVEEVSTRINMLQHDEITSRLNKSRRKPSLKFLLNSGTSNLSPEGSHYGSKDSTKVDPDWQYSCRRIESSAKRLKTLCLNTQQSQVVFQGREKCFAKPTEDQYGLGRGRDQDVQQGL